MKYGSTKTVKQYGEDGDVAELDLFHAGDLFGTYKQFKTRHIVHNQQEETTIYLRWANDMKEKRIEGKLIILQDDSSTIPSFTIKYPKKDIDGSYLIITTWTERV